jgi:hypothetical protein
MIYSKGYSNLFLTQDIVGLKFRAQVYLNKVYDILSNGIKCHSMSSIALKVDLTYLFLPKSHHNNNNQNHHMK